MVIVFIIIILVLIIVLIYNNKQNKENMTVVGEGIQKNSIKQPFTGTFTTFNGRMAIDDQYFYDKLFDDVVYYDNDYDYDTGDLIKTGWDKCKMQCTGNCVEYFVSGNSYCFPY
jgi:hypothetical protein